MPSQMSGGNNNGQISGPPSSTGVPGGGFKRGADEFDYNEQDAYKRPRTQTYPGVASSAEVDAYRRQHEVSALVLTKLRFTSMDSLVEPIQGDSKLNSHRGGVCVPVYYIFMKWPTF